MTGREPKRAGLRLHDILGDHEFELTPDRLVIAGFSGRDLAGVRAHIAELATIGVPQPRVIPEFYLLDQALLTTAPWCDADADRTSGEVEPVLIRWRSRYFLGVGSDHTDRLLERDGIQAAKAAAPKPISARVYAVNTLSEFPWDDVKIRSFADDVPYQDGTLAELLRPAELLELFRGEGDDGHDLVMFMGTVPLLSGEFAYAQHWRVELEVPDGTILTHSYKTRT